MILHSPAIPSADFQRRTGWVLKPEGLCKGDRCVPLPGSDPDGLDAHELSKRLGMPLIHDEGSDVWCLGPESDAPPFVDARAPELTLPDWKGEEFSLVSLRGQKVLLVAWASW